MIYMGNDAKVSYIFLFHYGIAKFTNRSHPNILLRRYVRNTVELTKLAIKIYYLVIRCDLNFIEYYIEAIFKEFNVYFWGKKRNLADK